MRNSEISCFCVPEEYQNDRNIIDFERKAGIRKLDRRGYDIIRDCFFAEEIFSAGNYTEKKITYFDDFGTYSDFVDNAIYDKACYYQCDISKIMAGVDYNRLNRQEFFVGETIDDYTAVPTNEEISLYNGGEQIKKQCKNWIDKFNACSTYDEFQEIEQNYRKSKLSTELSTAERMGRPRYSYRQYRDFFMWQYTFSSLNDKNRFNILMEYMSNYTCAGSLARQVCTVFKPDADLLLCDGLKNLNDVSGINLKNTRAASAVCDKFGIQYELYKVDSNKLESFSYAEENEISTEFALQTSIELAASDEMDSFRLLKTMEKVYYVSDIHLLHKLRNFEPKSEADVVYVIKSIVGNIVKESGKTILIGGDVSSDFSVFEMFVKILRSELDGQKCNPLVIFVFGNHELWEFPQNSFHEIVTKYNGLINEYGMYLLQNDIKILKGVYTKLPLRKFCPLEIRSCVKKLEIHELPFSEDWHFRNTMKNLMPMLEFIEILLIGSRK